MVCMFLPLGGAQCNIVILVFCFPLWSEGMDIPRVHRVWSDGCSEVIFSRAAAIYTSTNSVWPFAFTVCYSTGTPGLQMVKAQWKEVTSLLPVSRHDCHLDLLTLYHTCPVLHPSYSTVPSVWHGHSGCCRFASQRDWWVFERSFSSVNSFGTRL